MRDDFIADHAGYELASRLQVGTFNTLYFTLAENPTFYVAIRGDPTSPPGDVFCTPWVVNALFLGVSASGIPLQTCVEPGTSTQFVNLDRDDTPPGDPVILSDTAYCSPNTPAGEDVSVPLNGGTENLAGIDVTFAEVTTEGSTTIVTTTSGPPPPTGFEIVGLSGLPLYLDINTTDVEYSGDVTICVRYDGTQVIGPEANLKLMHYVDDAFDDVTTSVDTENDIICGTTTHLSVFAVIEVAPTPTPTPTATATPTPANTFTPTPTEATTPNPTPSVVGPIHIGGMPLGLASNPTTHKVYIARVAQDSVAVFWDTTNQLGPTIGVHSGPRGVGVNGVTNRIYVSNTASGSVSVISGATDAEIDVVTVGTSPHGVAVNPVTNRVYVANYGSGDVSVIDGTTHTVQGIGLGGGPWWVAVNPVTNRIYATLPDSDSVSVIDGQLGTWVKDVSVCDYPLGIAVNDDTNRIYVACAGSDQLSVIDGSTDTWTKNLPTGHNPYGVAVNRNTNRIYVAENQQSAVGIFDGESDQQLWVVPVGGQPWGLTVNEGLNRVYVTDGQSEVYVIQDYPLSVGGIAEHPQLEAGPGASGSSAPGTFAVGGIAAGGALLLIAGGWYARRRWRAG